MTAPQRRPAREPARSAASHRRGLERAPAARREARRLGAATGWHGRPDWRLTAFEADRLATALEAAGWRAAGVNLAQGVALVEEGAACCAGPRAGWLAIRQDHGGGLRVIATGPSPAGRLPKRRQLRRSTTHTLRPKASGT